MLGVWHRQFLAFELGLSIGVTALLGIVAWKVPSVPIWMLLDGSRASVYSAFASIVGSLLGFAITAVSVVIGFANHERLEVVRSSSHYMNLWKTFFSTIRWLGFATVWALACLIGDREQSPSRILFIGAVFAALMSIVRVMRCAWVLENVVSIVASNGSDAEQE